jgi:hypothetical protein
LQPGDRLDLSQTVHKTNSTGNTLNVAAPVYVQGGNAKPAQADSQSTVRVAGLVVETADDGNPVEVMSDGVFETDTTSWDFITGQTGGLTEGAPYFLSADTAGKLTLNAPDSHGDFVAPIGTALSLTEFDIEIGQPIKL